MTKPSDSVLREHSSRAYLGSELFWCLTVLLLFRLLSNSFQMFSMGLKSGLCEGQGWSYDGSGDRLLLWLCWTITILLKSTPWIGIKKAVHKHQLINKGIGIKTVRDCTKEGFDIKGDYTITLPPLLSLSFHRLGCTTPLNETPFTYRIVLKPCWTILRLPWTSSFGSASTDRDSNSNGHCTRQPSHHRHS